MFDFYMLKADFEPGLRQPIYLSVYYSPPHHRTFGWLIFLLKNNYFILGQSEHFEASDFRSCLVLFEKENGTLRRRLGTSKNLQRN